jgi:hypothetical protein
MVNLLESRYRDDVSAKDGGFVFQAIISHTVNWEIQNGETLIDPKKISAMLHQVDVFPDMKFTGGNALLTYVTLSEVNILKRKFELASEAIKKKINPDYAAESSAEAQISAQNRKALNEKYFKNTYYEVSLTTDHIVLREVSTSGLDSGAPKITLKLSTGMVDTLDGQPTGTWEKFKVKVDGTGRLEIAGSGEDSLSTIRERDNVENIDDAIFRTIVPSLLLDFKGDATSIDTYSHRSAQAAFGAKIDYKNLFNVEDKVSFTPPKDETSAE